MIATVTHRPAGHGSADWRFYCDVATRLVRGNVNRGEHVCVLLDMMSTPRGTAFEDVLRGRVNNLLRSTQVTSAVCLDSRSSDGLQVADLIAGAVAFERRRLAGESGGTNSPKARVVNRLKEAFGVDELTDLRTNRVNIQTWTPRPRLRVLPAAEPQVELGSA
jgi:hypothetical protein